MDNFYEIDDWKADALLEMSMAMQNVLAEDAADEDPGDNDEDEGEEDDEEDDDYPYGFRCRYED